MSDIFVAFPPATKDGTVVFGKNSDRPPTEVQEVVYFSAVDNSPGSRVHVSIVTDMVLIIPCFSISNTMTPGKVDLLFGRVFSLGYCRIF